MNAPCAVQVLSELHKFEPALELYERALKLRKAERGLASLREGARVREGGRAREGGRLRP